MIVVADASVSLKWLLPLQPNEADVPRAHNLHDRASRGELELRQPPHWMSEVLSILARNVPPAAFAAYAGFLGALQIKTDVSAQNYARAMSLSASLNHHLFDTLYHATALQTPGAVFVTADERYFRKAASLGQIMRLADWAIDAPTATDNLPTKPN